MTTGSTVLPRDVNILFAGLFFFAFRNQDPHNPEQYDEGHVAIFKTSPDHHLCIQLNDLYSFQIYQESLPLLPPILDIVKTAGTLGVTVHGGWDRPPDDSDPTRFGYILDFESNLLHGRQTGKHTSKLFSVLRFNAGTFTTDKLGGRVDAQQGTNPPIPLGPLAERIGVKVSLGSGEDLVFRVGTLSYTLPSTITKVLISNTCPTEDSSDEQLDLEEHYSLVDVPVREEFKFKIHNPRAHPFVCYTGGGSKTNGLL